jgi:hypothetical protein
MKTVICKHCQRTFDLSETDERIEYQYEHDALCEEQEDDIQTILRLIEGEEI